LSYSVRWRSKKERVSWNVVMSMAYYDNALAMSSLRGALATKQNRGTQTMDCFASLAMTVSNYLPANARTCRMIPEKSTAPFPAASKSL
jgi:hypothetical protein